MKPVVNRDDLVPEEKPPLFKDWRQIYLVILGWLLVLIVLFACITNYYS